MVSKYTWHAGIAFTFFFAVTFLVALAARREMAEFGAMFTGRERPASLAEINEVLTSLGVELPVGMRVLEGSINEGAIFGGIAVAFTAEYKNLPASQVPCLMLGISPGCSQVDVRSFNADREGVHVFVEKTKSGRLEITATND